MCFRSKDRVFFVFEVKIMFSAETQLALVDDHTLGAMDAIYNYQIQGETVTWTYADASYYAPIQYTQAVQEIVRAVDSLIDLDFQYTSNYLDADYLTYVYDYTIANRGILGTHANNFWWGLTEVFYDPNSTWQSNVNTFVHEFGHYLGLGEPGWDWRFDQSDTAMSYNTDPIISGGFQTFFTLNDQIVLVDLHGRENDFITGI